MRAPEHLCAAMLAALIASVPACEPRAYDEAETETRAAEEVPAPAPATPAATPDSPATPNGDTTVDASAAQRTIPFQPGPQSETSGTVSLRETRSRELALGVSLTGLSEGDHAWHIRRAPCGVDGPIALAISAAAGDTGSLAQPLHADADGNAGGTVTIPAGQVSPELRYALRPEDPADPQPHVEPLSLQVHERAGADPGPIVACADLTVMAPPTTR